MSTYVVDGATVSYFDDYFFSKPQPMPEADAASFQPVEDWFAKDRRHVYFLYRIVPGADPESFTYLGGYNSQWAKDKDRAYYFWPSKAAGQFWAIESKSLDAFALLPRGPFAAYARDRECVYYLGKRIRGADAASFHILDSDRMGEVAGASSYHFAKDAARVYFDGKPLKEADYASFKVVHAPGLGNQEYGVDRNRAYHQSAHTGKAVPIAHGDLPAIVRTHLFLN